MNLIDKAKITIRSGKGGDGCVSFRREKFIEFGGPDGGNGGNGGDVYLLADKNLNSLLDFKYKKHFFAQNGQHGMGKIRTGKNGSDLIIKVPVGTIIYESDQKTFICDLDEDGKKYLIAKGGNGGFGNHYFKSSVKQSPTHANKGQDFIEKDLFLSLKLLADCGLVGLPNAGKSTLLSVISNARPKIADYPFTTLSPKIGVIKHKNANPFVMADIPGLIKGAHKNIGLGFQFLGHVERCKLLIFLLDGSEAKPYDAFFTLTEEIRKYENGLEKKKFIIVVNKIDVINDEKIEEIKSQFKENKIDKEIIFISAFQKKNLTEFLDKLITELNISTEY